MSNSSDARMKRPRAESELSRESTRDKRPRHESEPAIALLGTPVTETDVMEEHEREEPPQSGGQLPNIASSSDDSTDADGNQKLYITSIRATDVALGLRRIPAGFYAAVHHSGQEWRTENKRLPADADVIEWNEPILIRSKISLTVCLEVYASFEFQHMLGAGEQLRRITVTIDQLLDHSEREVPFYFFPEQGDVVSPCSSILVTVELCVSGRSNLPLQTLSPRRVPTESLGELEDATNQGHAALARYRKQGAKQDLEYSISAFQRAFNVCPPDNPCRAAAQSNLAMAKFIFSQAEHKHASLEVSLSFYRDVLRTRPPGHVDRPSTLIHLAAVYLAVSERSKDGNEQVQAETLLWEAVDLSVAGSHENKAASIMLQLQGERRLGGAQRHGPSSVELDPVSHSTDLDQRMLFVQLMERFEHFGHIDDLHRAVMVSREWVRSTAALDEHFLAGLGNLGTALSHRFQRLGELGDLEEAISTLKDAIQLTPHGHRHKPGFLDTLGTTIFTRFEHLGELHDLKEAILAQREAVQLTPRGHPRKPGSLNNLGNSLRARFLRLGEIGDLDEAILTLRDGVQLTLDGDFHKPTLLDNLASSLDARFEHVKALSDLEEAISTQKVALDLIPRNHPERPRYLNNIGASFMTRFKHFGELGDLKEAISFHREAVRLTPDGHPARQNLLSNLGSSVFTRFQCLGELDDLEEAILIQKHVIGLTPDGHPGKSDSLNNLGSSFEARFKRLGDLGDLEEARSTLRAAIKHTSPDNPDQALLLRSLGRILRTRFERLGALGDLEEAISVLRRLTSHDHPERSSHLHLLGNSLLTRFQHIGDLENLKEAISTQKEAVQHIPDGHPLKPVYLTNLGNSLAARFRRFGELGNLEDAISNQRTAVQHTPDGHPDKPGFLNNLGISLEIRFKRLGELADLKEAISAQMTAVKCTPDGHPDKPSFLKNLAASFRTRFECHEALGDLEKAILALEHALRLTPHDQPDKPSYLNILGACFFTRFEHVGGLADLKEAISTQNHAISLTLDGHLHKPIFLSNLANFLRSRFEYFGVLDDLKQAISTQNTALQLIPDDHPEKPAFLNNLRNSFFARFKHFGKLSDLEEAISILRNAVQLTPDDHSDKPKLLNNLGSAFQTRFEHLGELHDLEDAIFTLTDAVQLTSKDHPRMPSFLNNLSMSFQTRFEHFGELSDLEQAISILKDAIQHTPDSHPEKPRYLNNLGVSFITRFRHLREISDLEDAISTQKNAVNAVKLAPDGHADMPAFLNNLGNFLGTRFTYLGKHGDLDDAMSIQKDAIWLTPNGHPDKPGRLINHAKSFIARFECLGEHSDIEAALALLSHAASAPSGPIEIRFRASLIWISCAHSIRHHSLLCAYAVTIDLLPQLAWIGLSLIHRYSQLARGAASEVVREAAAVALEAGLPEIAVDWLERGRSIVWGELLQLRSSYEELTAAYPDLASRFRELSTALDHAGGTREKSMSAQSEQPPSGVAPHFPDTLRQEADRHRVLAIERDDVLREIRRMPGFEEFLRHKTFSQLRASAHAGPIVLLNAADSRCDALIVLANVDHVIHVPLPNFNLKRSANLQNMLNTFIRSEREGKSAESYDFSWESCLAPLWRCVVKPVLEALAFAIPGYLSRIFWCPTGPFTFLPIHAAGFYDAAYSQPGHKVFDFVVSSYVPTLAMLSPSVNPRTAVAPSDNLRLLAVRQPSSDGLPRLHAVSTELEHIKEVLRKSPLACTTLVESSSGTVDEVLYMMKDSDWVHFACHGVQDGADSGLCLADQRRLKVRDIIALLRPRGGLAFLSACQTAKGEKRLSDETIHIAAGMLFAGYSGVIGTMWSISDSLAPVVAREVYEHLFQKGTRPDHQEAARALHEAVALVRDRDMVPFDEWVPFIHVGL